MQLAELREYAARRGDLEIIGEFVDRGVSGTRWIAGATNLPFDVHCIP